MMSASSPSQSLRQAVAKRPALFLALLFVAIAVAVSLYDSNLSLNPEQWRCRGDFAEYTLRASHIVLKGGNPYGHEDMEGRAFRYFPVNAIIYVPLSLLPLPIAQGVWVAANVVLLILALRCHTSLAGLCRAGKGTWFIALLVGLPFILPNFHSGQWNLPVYSITLLGLWLIIARGRPWAGGLVVGLAGGIKYMPITFALYFLAKRHWRAAAAIPLATAFWVLVVPTAFLGYERHGQLLTAFSRQGIEDIRNMVDQEEVLGHSLLATSYSYLTPCIRHPAHAVTMEMRGLNLPPGLAENIAIGLCACLVAGTLVAFWRSGKGTEPGPTALMEVAMALLLMLMISPEVRKAQLLTIFTPAFALGLLLFRTEGPAQIRRTSFWALGACTILMAAAKRGIGAEALRRYALVYGALTAMLLILYGGLMYVYLRWRDEVHFPEPRPRTPKADALTT
jgi:hypothetical protein